MKKKRAIVLSVFVLLLIAGGGFVLWRLFVPSYAPVDYSQKYFEHSRFAVDAPAEGGEGYLAVLALAALALEREAAINNAIWNDWRSLGFSEAPQMDFGWHLLWGLGGDEDWVDLRAVELAHEELEKLESEGFFDDLTSALALRDLSAPLHGPSLFASLVKDELTIIRVLGTLELERLVKALDAGDAEIAARIMTEIIQLARSAGSEAVAIEYITEMSIAFSLFNELQAWAVMNDVPADFARAILASLERAAELHRPSRTLEGDRLMSLSAIQWLHHMRVRDLTTVGALIRIVNSQANRVDRVNKAFDDALALAASDRVGDMRARIDEIEHQFDDDLFYRVLFAPGFVYVWTWQQLKNKLGGVRLMLALEIYRDDHGAYPETLAVLAPEILDAIPEDPFAADGRFVYRRIDTASDAHRRGYLLYSVGADGVDDGGVVDAQEPTRALSRKASAGTDYVFNGSWDDALK